MRRYRVNWKGERYVGDYTKTIIDENDAESTISYDQFSILEDLIYKLTNKTFIDFNETDTLFIYAYVNDDWESIVELPLEFGAQSFPLINRLAGEYLINYLRDILAGDEYLDWKLVNFKEI